jgi:hypothetical protein
LQLRNDRKYVLDVLNQGQRKAKEIAHGTMDAVYAKLGIKSYH